MNILGNNASKLNAVVFENRNKNYGAYVIRESYNDSLIKSLLCLGSMVVLVFGSAYAYNKANAVIPTETGIVIDDLIPETLEYVTEIDNTPKPEPVQNTSAPAAAPEGAIGTVIDDHAVETSTVNLENPISGVGSATATGTSLLGPETSTTTAAAIAVTTSVTAIPEVFIAEEMPEFEGGIAGLMRYVMQNISYPEIAREIGKEGTVHVSFVVNEVGNVEGVRVVKGIGYGCDEEVLRVIGKMPRWKKGGKNGGHPVKVRFNIPVSFRLK
jgi:protein TonB